MPAKLSNMLALPTAIIEQTLQCRVHISGERGLTAR